MVETIRIKYSNDVKRIEKLEVGDWIDLRSSEDVFVRYGEVVAIPLGVSMELPKGYEAIVAPRSSTYKTFGIVMVNGIGIIDNSYNGNNDTWHFLAMCVSKRTIHNGYSGVMIRKNDRICQFRIQRIQPELEFVEVDDLNNSDRGGIGSTGMI